MGKQSSDPSVLIDVPTLHLPECDIYPPKAPYTPSLGNWIPIGDLTQCKAPLPSKEQLSFLPQVLPLHPLSGGRPTRRRQIRAEWGSLGLIVKLSSQGSCSRHTRTADAEQMPLLSAILLGSLPSPWAQPALTFKAKYQPHQTIGQAVVY